ncbi:exodeoxyribonuclease III [Georgenia sp. 311]|uniref:exodeoxyribonuclease III n=1 Tax=Georgenia sp. 311 TaxID=2585134 RepID=UPI0011119B9B|nr:exodeoxyribonuclease III [Georgenia sp. 311]TNC18361.1 exodeoxyribonuclease III [Georgenia sp. 311]
MRLATWNVNSVRARVDRVVAFLERSGTDVLAMQETKCRDDQFPHLAFHAAGYEVVHHGLSQWNGVAIASRLPLEDVEAGFDGMPTWGEPAAAEARAIGATVGGVRVWSLYVPNGRALDDPHYRYKLDWLAALRTAALGWQAADPAGAVALVGDWNIAPLDEDVWDVAAFAGATHVSQPEREALAALRDAGLTEVTRRFTPGAYTYWDYKQLRFPRNEGMRIDLALTSPVLAARATGAHVDRDERKGKGASDHAPVVIDID